MPQILAPYRLLALVLAFQARLLLGQEVVSETPALERSDERPNVIVILTDDQGWGDLSLHGNQNFQTPNLDLLAKTGARFARFYVCPVCAPTRAEFLTGRYHLRGGVLGVTRGEERLDTDERTIAEFFSAAGYETAMFGKWHNGMQFPYHPNARGFDEFYGYCAGHWGDYFSPQLDHNGRLTQGEGYLVDDFTDHALEFIEENQRDPFFLYLAMPTPHSPMQVPEEYWSRMKDKTLTSLSREGEKEDQDFTRAALAMVQCIDANVGRILNKLDDTQLAKDTIVVFFCDNGPNSFRWNGGMKGKKGSTDEGGIRSPLFISWPGKIRENRLVTQIAGAIDLLPTLSELCNIPLLNAKPLDGENLTPLLVGSAGSLPDRVIYTHWNNKVSVRTQNFRLDAAGKLFDMNLDPGQSKDVAEQFPEVQAELEALAAAWKSNMMMEVGGSLEDERPFAVGYADFPLTQLPARDGIPHGGVERSAKAPNCSYFKNWKSASDSITWDIDVLEPGNFAVDMYYACPEETVGTEVTLSFGGERISTEVQQANDSPAVGPEHDRVPRKTQSPMKDFKPLRLGVIRLEAGTGELKLQADGFPEDAELEMRMLILRRVR